MLYIIASVIKSATLPVTTGAPLFKNPFSKDSLFCSYYLKNCNLMQKHSLSYLLPGDKNISYFIFKKLTHFC